MLGVLAGIPIGIICSLISWWMLFHVVSPKLEFAPKINKYKSSISNEIRYRIKFANIGKRNMIDVEILGRMRIKGLYKQRPNIVEVVDIQLAKENIPILRPISKIKTSGTMIRIKISDTKFFSSPDMPELIKNKLRTNQLTLEDTLEMGTSATLQFVIMGYDEYSGSRKLFESQVFDKSDIEYGVYSPDNFDIISDKHSEESVASIETIDLVTT